MTTTVTGTIKDVTGQPDNSAWVFYSVLREGDASDVVTSKWVRAVPVAGALSVDLESGFCIVNAPNGQVYNITVPDSGTPDIWDLLAAAVAFPPGTSADAVAAAITAYLTAHPPAVSWTGVTGKPAVIAAGADQATARAAISVAPTQYYVDNYGADPTGVGFSDTAVAAAITAMGTGAGTLVFGAGTYKLNSTVSLLYPCQGIKGQGAGSVGTPTYQFRGLTKIDWRGTGDCIRAWDSSVPTNGSSGAGTAGPITGLYIDGFSNANTSIVGIHIGDLFGIHIDNVTVEGFETSGSVGFWGQNLYTWSERAWVQINVNSCTTAYLFSPGGSNTANPQSWCYGSFFLSVQSNANQNCVVLNKSILSGVYFSLFGNCATGTTNTGVVLNIGAGGAGDNSAIRGVINVNVECNGTGTGHKDINTVSTCAGIIGTGALYFEAVTVPFVAGNVASQPWTVQFSGLVRCPSIGTSDAQGMFGAGQFYATNGVAGPGLIDSNGNPAFAAGTIGTSAVNYLQAYGGQTGIAPALYARGSDTNVDINLVPKGTGSLKSNSVKVALAVETVNTVATSGSAQTIPDPATGATMNRVTLTANCTFTFPTAAAGKSLSIATVQDGTGSRTATWPAAVHWPGGVAPTLTTAAAKVDRFTFFCDDGSTWAGFVAGQNFS